MRVEFEFASLLLFEEREVGERKFESECLFARRIFISERGVLSEKLAVFGYGILYIDRENER